MCSTDSAYAGTCTDNSGDSHPGSPTNTEFHSGSTGYKTGSSNNSGNVTGNYTMATIASQPQWIEMTAYAKRAEVRLFENLANLKQLIFNI